VRVQLLSDHVFDIAGAGAVALKEASIIGAQPGDYPVSSILNFVATPFMAGLDAEGVSAVGGAGGPKYSRITAPSDGGMLPLPAAFGGKSWAAA
jgi:hypothetical protein